MPAIEPHYSVKDVAGMWKLSDEAIRRLFREEPGVIKLTAEERYRRRKRDYVTLRIPESVLVRVHEKLRHRG
jgi:hypothetical protein